MRSSDSLPLRAALAQVALLLIVVTSPGSTQQPSWIRHVMDDSSGSLGSGDITPDERWIVYTRDLSQQESEVLVRATAGGAPRKLVDVRGRHLFVRFSPKGDRVLFASSIPQRDPADISMYIMAAPFDSRTGTLSGPPRQISFDPIIMQPRFRPAISPDGELVAYVDGRTTAVKVVPITGGNARTLFTPSRRHVPSAPSTLSWTPDGAFVRYTIAESRDQTSSYQVSVNGGTPTAAGTAGLAVQGGRLFARYSRVARGKPATLRFFDSNGRQSGTDLVLPSALGNGLPLPSPDGKYLVFSSFAALADIRIVATTGGPVRNTVTATAYDWPVGWTADSRIVLWTTADREMPAYRGARADGSLTTTSAVGEGAGSAVAVIGATIIERPWGRSQSAFQAVNPTDGSRRRLVDGAYDDRGCCRAPGGAYTASADEFFFTRRVNGRIEVRAATLAGGDRLVAELPPTAVDEDKAVFGDRVAYTEPVGDSVRLLVKSGRAAALRLATFARGQAVGESVWSWDGRRLAVQSETSPQIHIYEFDGAGKLVGGPTRLTTPFSYQYELMWLRDGSALTMVAQPRDAPSSHIAVVPLADPSRPLILTRDDPSNKWGHALSPDGKLVAYSAERLGEAGLWLIDVEQAVAAARRR